MIVVPLTSRRFEWAQLIQKLQHVLPSFTLLSDGMRRVRAEPHPLTMALGAAEVVTSALVIVAFVLALRRARRSAPTPHSLAPHPHHTHRIDWVDVFLSGMLATEVMVHYHETGHIRRPTVLLAVTMLVFGLMHARMLARAIARRSMRVTDRGIVVPGRFFTRFTADYADLARIDVGEHEAAVVRRDGRTKRINLDGVLYSHAVRDALLTARAHLTRDPKRAEDGQDHASADSGAFGHPGGGQQTETH